VLVDEIPLRGPGKPDRAAIRALARDAVSSHPSPTVDLRTVR